MAISKVGLGWDVGERDYASLNLWVSGKSASGVAEQAHCKGSCTTATLNITSGFSAGALIYGDVEYDGSNESALAFANNRINITVANVVVEDLSIAQSSNFINTAVANGSGVVYRRCRIRHLGAHGTSYAALQALNGGTAENCVVSTAGARVTNHSFNNPLTFSNCQFFGSTGIGVGPIYSAFQTVINCFSFNNAGDDYFTANPSDETFDCASEDLTGNVTGYTSTECVDFANNDFRIKNTSDLHALNIGAFFEASGGGGSSLSIAETLPNLTSAVVLTNVNPTTNVSISTLLPALSSNVVLQNTTPENNLVLSESLPALESSVVFNYKSISNIGITESFGALQSVANLTYQPAGITLTINDDLPVLLSSATISNTLPQYSITISESLAALQSAVNLVNGTPESNLTIATMLPRLVSGLLIANEVPAYNLSVVTQLPSLNSSVVISYQDITHSLNINEVLPALQSTIDIENIVPTYSFNISDTFSPLQSSVNLINGELLIYVGVKNIVTIKVNNIITIKVNKTFPNIKPKSNFVTFK
jgi:hypothetical protein